MKTARYYIRPALLVLLVALLAFLAGALAADGYMYLAAACSVIGFVLVLQLPDSIRWARFRSQIARKAPFVRLP